MAVVQRAADPLSRAVSLLAPALVPASLATFSATLGRSNRLITHVHVGGRTLVTYSLHLESRGDDHLRRAQLREVLFDAQRYNQRAPLVMAGDLNLDATQGLWPLT
jgi:endonuclease/exonuclease/phosphatase family metal-dependent hydrolase